MPTYYGTPGDDHYNYTNSDDFLAYGYGGDDTLLGGDGNDSLYGGAGNDYLSSNGGNDFFYGGAGNDRLEAFSASSTSLFGGLGDDSLYSYSGNDILRGGAGNDILYSSSGNDTLTGGTGADTFGLDVIPTTALFATITDFRTTQGDKIFVYGDMSFYFLDQSQNISGGSALDTAIYFENGFGDYLIAVVQDTTQVSLSSDFIFATTLS